MPNITQIVSALKNSLASLLPGSQQADANTANLETETVSRFLVYIKHPVQYTRCFAVNATDLAHAQALAQVQVVGDWTIDRIIAQ